MLLPELALSVRTERFLREIQIAAKLTHPHILPLHDSGEAGGFLYYVMPYVKGESLRARLDRERQLPVEEALRITRDVAAALSHAHERGVVHRDIKPENILLEEGGEAIVTDFGIARALTVAGGQTVTETGVAVGTPAYMSPEQATGAAVLDARSDQYSVGCVVYEMLAGHPPFPGETAQEVLARHTLDPVPSLKAARPDVPVAVERAVRKALAKTPQDRFPSMVAFWEALNERSERSRRRAYAYAIATAAILLGALAWRYVHRAPADQSVAVLPFVNMSGDTSSEYFSDGMTEDLIDALTQVSGLRVPARTSSFAFKGKSVVIGEIARQLNVTHVVEGSVRRSGNALRVTAQLIDVTDGYHLWSQRYDRTLTGARDIFAMQDSITRAIVGALRVRLRAGDTTSLVSRSTDDPDAYDLYLRGRYLLARRSRSDDEKAIENFSRAIARDPTYARAYSGLADAYLVAGNVSFVDPDVAFPRAKAAAVRALTLDSSLAEAYASLARVYTNYEWDVGEAERLYRRAIALNPAYAEAHSWFANWLLGPAGRFDDAIREARKAVELDPLAPYTHNNLGVVLMWARRYDQAIAELREAIELVPDWEGPRRYLAEAYLGKGMYQEALAQLQMIRRRINPSGGRDLARIGTVLALMGRRSEAAQILGQVRAVRGARGDVYAALYLALGEKDSALVLLEHAYDVRPAQLRYIKVDAALDPLRGEPRFQALLRKMGLES